MGSDIRERDFAAYEESNYPGMIIPEMFNNTQDVGDGFPGLQAAVRNWVTWWLHSGNMDSGLNLNGYDITGVENVVFSSITGNLISGTKGNFTESITGLRGKFTEYASGLKADFVNITGAKGKFVDITGTNAIITNVLQNTSSLLPIGTILMYNGTALGGTLSTRTSQIGDEGGDTITMPGWYVCNGKASTPNLTGTFIAGATTFGQRGDKDGSDGVTLGTSEVPGHTHGTIGNHGHAGSSIGGGGSHTHTIRLRDGVTQAGHVLGGHFAGTDQGLKTISGASSHDHTFTVASAGGHTHSSVGGGGSHENRPPFYKLVYITRMS